MTLRWSLTLVLLAFGGCTKTARPAPPQEVDGENETVTPADAAAGHREQGAAAASDANDADRLMAELHSEDPGVRERALLVAGELRTAEALPAVAEAMFATEERVRRTAAVALASYEPTEASAAMLEAMREPREGQIPREAFVALAELGEPAPQECLDVLANLAASSPLREERASAAAALAILGQTGAVPILIELVQDEDAHVAAAAEDSLAVITFESAPESWGSWWLEHGDQERSAWAHARLTPDNFAALATGADEQRLISGMSLKEPARAALKRDLLAALAFLEEPGADASEGAAATLLRVFRASPFAAGRVAAVALAPDLPKVPAGGEAEAELLALLFESMEDEAALVRTAGFRAVARGRVFAALPACIEALSDDEYQVRNEAFGALSSYAGETHHYDPAAPATSAKRKFAQEVWRSWYESEAARRGRR